MSSTILAYAFLRAFYNRGVQNPLDALIPLVKRALMDNGNKKIDQKKIQRSIRDRTGLDIPINVIRYTFPALAREEILELDTKSYIYQLRSQFYVDEEVKQLEQAARDTYNRLVSNTKKVIEAENSRDFEADELIEYWLDTSALSFLGSINPAYNADRKDREANRLIALGLKNPFFGETFLTDLTEVAMGDCLFRAIKGVTEYDVEHESAEDSTAEIDAIFKKKMDRVSVYFDTRFVLRAIGFVNEDLKKAAEEVLGLCRAAGAEVYIFDHTVEEVRRIIESVAIRLKYSQVAEGDIAYYAYQNGLEAGDLVDLAAQIEDKIEDAGFGVQPPPAVIADLSVDEKVLDERLRRDLKQEYELARITDIRSLTGIYRLRNGEPKIYLEDCDAIFVTTNKGLADSSVLFFRKTFEDSHPRNRVQICMTDVVFSTRLWTKLPTAFDRLPRLQIVAHVLGNLRPSSKLRGAFAKQLRDLVSSGKLSEEGAARLRLSRFADEILALEFESSRSEIFTEEAIGVANKVIAKQKELWDKIKRDAEATARTTIRNEIEGLEKELSKLAEDPTFSSDNLKSLEDEISQRNLEIEILESREKAIRNKIERLVPWLTRTIGFVCLFWMFNVFFGLIPSLSAMFDAIGLARIGAFAGGLGLWSERIAAAVLGFLTLGGFSLAGLQKQIERWLVRRTVEFLFE